MASHTFEVKRYEITMGDKLIIGVQGAGVRCQALIRCRGSANEGLDVFVVSDGQDRSNTSDFTAQPVAGRMFVGHDQFAWYLDLLRNEKVFATLEDSTPEMNRLACGASVGWGHME